MFGFDPLFWWKCVGLLTFSAKLFNFGKVWTAVSNPSRLSKNCKTVAKSLEDFMPVRSISILMRMPLMASSRGKSIEIVGLSMARKTCC